MEWPIEARWICAVLTATGGVLLALRLGGRASRVAWSALLVAGLANAIVISAHENNLVNINLVHHYLGAKYAFPYNSCYRLINAALERPQVAMRDLDHPPAMLREDSPSQRAYFIDLIREDGVDFDPLSPLPDLEALAVESGAVARESEQILREYLPADRIDDFRRDTRRAVGGLEGRDITTDYGFNGSPFYTLVRQADPTLHLEFGAGTAYLNLMWQIAAALLLAWVAGAAIGLGANGRIAAAALLFASWDFVGWALPGLVFAGLWLPVAVALYAFRRFKAPAGGIAVAWAGLIKLFPFVLLLPALARLARIVRDDGGRRWSLQTIGWCAVSVAALGVAALAVGRSWGDFLHKIVVQFQSQSYLLNSVSLSQGLLTIGVVNSPLSRVLSILSIAALAAMFLPLRDDEFRSSLPRRSLVLIAAMGWVAHTWFNYYAIAPYLVLPLLARRHRAGAAAGAIAMAVAVALPEFDDPVLLSRPALHGLKVAPYLALPLWLVVSEFRSMALGPRARRVALVAIAIAAVATVGETVRMRSIDRLNRAGSEYLDRGDGNRALETYRRLVKIAPRNAMARMNEAIALATLGRMEEAGPGFARAVELAPESPATRRNYGNWLLRVGRQGEAAEQMEAARDLAPHDDGALLSLARIRLAQGRTDDAVDLLTRARELNPDNRAVGALLRESEAP